MLKFVCDICWNQFDPPGQYPDRIGLEASWGDEGLDDGFEIFRKHVCRPCALDVKAAVEECIGRLGGHLTDGKPLDSLLAELEDKS